jgi:hypothetical protein
MKHFFAFFSFFLALTLVQCTDNTIGPVQNDNLTKGGPPPGKGGGGHTETATNNLSFPALCADGYTIIPIINTTFVEVYAGPFDGLSAEQLDYVMTNGPWYAQKVEGNVWQADFETVSSVNVTFIDWGDAIESVDPKVGRPFRLELALYSNQYGLKTAYTMTELAFPSSPDETQGTNKVTYESEYAAVASPLGRLVVQRFNNEEDLSWNGDSWDGALSIENVVFAQELNVGGRLIYGASTGGWKPTEPGNYRITFYMTGGSTVNFSGAIIADKTAPETPKVSENNQPYVSNSYNLSYVDVQVTTGGGGGGGNH